MGIEPARRLRAPREEIACRRTSRHILWHVPALPGEIVEAMWDNPDRLIAAGTMLKDGDRCTVVRLDPTHATNPPQQPSAAGGGGFVLKRYNTKGTLHTVAHLLLRSRARWCWLNGWRLVAAGLPTPAPLACLEERRGGVLRGRSFLLTDFILGRSLRDVIERDPSTPPSREDLRSWARQFAAILQALGHLRIGHGDMKATNFMVDPLKQLWLIDLDGVRVYRSHLLLRRERRNDMARFMRNWQARPEVAAIFRAQIGTG